MAGTDSAESWTPQAAHGALDAHVRLPGSKSITNRAYVLAALASEPTHVRDPLDSRDTRLMLDALAALGASHTPTEHGVRITPIGAASAASAPREVAVELGNAGTVARFTPALAALGTARVRFDGDAAIRGRPIGPLLRALGELGVDLEHGGRDAPPFVVRGHGDLPGGSVELDASASSQFLSALLLAGPRSTRGITVRLVGTQPPSEPHIAMTLDVLRAFGATPLRDSDVLRVAPAELARAEFTVEPDLSTAAPFVLAPLVAGGTTRIAGWPHTTTQPGGWLRRLAERLGARVDHDGSDLSITAASRPHGCHLDLHEVGELTPVVAALLCLADGPSRISGVAHLRGHETDRLAALAGELSNLGPTVTETDDGLRIDPAPLRAGVFDSHDDHRLVMAGALLSLAHGGVAVANPTTVGKTFPGFVAEWERLVASSHGATTSS